MSTFRASRRATTALASLVLAAPALVKAQSRSAIKLVGMVDAGFPTRNTGTQQRVRETLTGMGWVEGKNIRYELRFAEQNAARAAQVTAELMALNPDLIFTNGSGLTVAPVVATNKTIPLVIGSTGDILKSGYVNNLARPEGNVTGISMSSNAMFFKSIELLMEVAPDSKCLGILSVDPPKPFPPGAQLPIRQVTQADIRIVQVETADRIRPTLTEMKRDGVDVLFVWNQPLFYANVAECASSALLLRLPCITECAGFAQAGGLIQFGVDAVKLTLRGATYVDKILRGAQPGDLPVYQSTEVRLILNLATAHLLGRKIPDSLIARADEIIG